MAGTSRCDVTGRVQRAEPVFLAFDYAALPIRGNVGSFRNDFMDGAFIRYFLLTVQARRRWSRRQR